MATAYHYFGPCIPQTDTGSSNAFEALGVSEDGGRIEEEPLVKPVKSDLGGSEAPVEFQQMGLKVTCRVKLVAIDEAVLIKMKKLSIGNTTEGVPATPGLLMGTNSKRFSLYLPSSTQAPWVLTNCRLISLSIKEGTEYGVYELVIEAWRYVAGTASTNAGAVYTRTTPP